MTVEPGRTRVGWIGTGVMGLSMCGHVLDAGYSVTVHNRTRERAEPLLDRGATWADTPAAVAASAGVSAQDAPRSISGWARSFVRLWTVME